MIAGENQKEKTNKSQGVLHERKPFKCHKVSINTQFQETYPHIGQ